MNREAKRKINELEITRSQLQEEAQEIIEDKVTPNLAKPKKKKICNPKRNENEKKKTKLSSQCFCDYFTGLI